MVDLSTVETQQSRVQHRSSDRGNNHNNTMTGQLSLINIWDIIANIRLYCLIQSSILIATTDFQELDIHFLNPKLFI